MKSKIVVAALLLTASITANAAAPILIRNAAPSPANNVLTGQQVCTQTGTDLAPVAPNALWNTGGVESLNRSLDRQLLKKNIVAYKIKWSTGWSGWYVKGVNDLVNYLYPNNLPQVGGYNARLYWIYASDHQWQYIACNSL